MEILKIEKIYIFLLLNEKPETYRSWQQNEKMILDGNGFLVKLEYIVGRISYIFLVSIAQSLHIFPRQQLGIILKPYFNNITHKSMYLAIKYLKNKSKFLYIGSQTLYSKKSFI